MAVAASVKINKRDMANIEKMLGQITPKKNKRIVRDGLGRCAYLVQKTTTEEMIVRGRAKDAPPLAKKLTNRSGGAGLIGSIAVDLPKEGLATVGTALKYGAIHEFGESGYPKRPFLSPALKKASKKFSDLFLKTINRELNR